MRHVVVVVGLVAAGCGGSSRGPVGPGPVAVTPPATPIRLDVVRPAAPGGAQPAPIIAVMSDELTRSMAALGKHSDPPYFASYEVSERSAVYVSASIGALQHSSDSRSRMVDVDVRVGDYKLDNTHALRGGDRYDRYMRGNDHTTTASVPIEDDEYAIRSALWSAMNRAYRSATQEFQHVQA